jgi:hypothetical protein
VLCLLIQLNLPLFLFSFFWSIARDLWNNKKTDIWKIIGPGRSFGVRQAWVRI